MTVTLALLTCLLFGLSDFAGGLLSRRIPTLTVVVASYALATTALGVLVLATGAWSEVSGRLWLAVIAGVIGPLAMFGFYRALADGPMGVVSPLTTLSVAVPVGVAVFLGERPGSWQSLGLVVAVLGVVLAGGPRSGGAPVERRTVLVSLGAAIGFGAVMVLIAEAATSVTGLLLALFVQRLCNLVIGGSALAVLSRRRTAPPPADRPSLTAALPLLVFVGFADVAANGTYALAYQIGPVLLASVLTSLYPVVTAGAARLVLGEKLLAVQTLGAGLALGGSLLLAGG